MSKWRVIPGFSWLEITKYGKIRLIRNKKLKTQCNDKDGYKYISEKVGEKYKNLRVHRLVLLTFKGEPPKGKSKVNHKDLDKSNNYYKNLEWCTSKENTHHARRLKGSWNPKGEDNHNAKLTWKIVHKIRKYRKKGYTYKRLAKKFKVNEKSLYDILKYKTWKEVSIIHVGIDPGIGGAVARIKNKKVKVYKTPTIIRKIQGRNKKTVKDFDIKACVELIKKLKHYERKDKGITEVKVWIEGVHPFLGSKVSNFNLGRSKGIWEGIIKALNLDYELVGMLKWKNEFLGDKRDKGEGRKLESVKVATELYPKLKKKLKLKKDADMAEAVLIAEYGRRMTR